MVNRHRPRQTFGALSCLEPGLPPRSYLKLLKGYVLELHIHLTHIRIALNFSFESHNMSEKAGPGVGFEFPSYEVSWLKRDLLLFAASIGATYPEELHFLYVSHRSSQNIKDSL